MIKLRPYDFFYAVRTLREISCRMRNGDFQMLIPSTVGEAITFLERFRRSRLSEPRRTRIGCLGFTPAAPRTLFDHFYHTITFSDIPVFAGYNDKGVVAIPVLGRAQALRSFEAVTEGSKYNVIPKKKI